MAESLTLDWAPLWQSILEDLAGGIDTAEIAARFHAGVAGAVAAMAIRLCEREGLKTAVLSGGSFQNRLLLEGVAERLRGAGIKVMAPERYPANDGGIALGQAVIATARWMNR